MEQTKDNLWLCRCECYKNTQCADEFQRKITGYKHSLRWLVHLQDYRTNSCQEEIHYLHWWLYYMSTLASAVVIKLFLSQRPHCLLRKVIIDGFDVVKDVPVDCWICAILLQHVVQPARGRIYKGANESAFHEVIIRKEYHNFTVWFLTFVSNIWSFSTCGICYIVLHMASERSQANEKLQQQRVSCHDLFCLSSCTHAKRLSCT